MYGIRIHLRNINHYRDIYKNVKIVATNREWGHSDFLKTLVMVLKKRGIDEGKDKRSVELVVFYCPFYKVTSFVDLLLSNGRLCT